MPGWLVRFLPHIGIALALVGIMWWLDDRGYDRAMADRDARDKAMLEQMRSDLRQSEQRLAISIGNVAGDYQRQNAALARTSATLQPIILKEAARDSRLTDPALGITGGMLDAINRARQAGPCAAAAADRIECTVPAPAADQRNRDR